MSNGDYFTHPDHMRGATLQKQNVMMHKQLSYFEKEVRKKKEMYFTPTHNNMLRDLVPSNVIVTSLTVLRELVKREVSRQHKKGIDINTNELVKHFDDFFHTITYLRKMKKDFTDKIYSVLFEFFYPSVLNIVPEMLGNGGKRMSKVKNDNLSIITSNIDPTDDEEEMYYIDEEFTNDCKDMRDIIETLHHVNYRWEKLITNDDIDANFFDMETLKELRKYEGTGSKNFEYMLRLVPDVLNKSLRAIKLAKTWWFTADKLSRKLEQYKEVRMPRRRRSIVDIPKPHNIKSDHDNYNVLENETPPLAINYEDHDEPYLSKPIGQEKSDMTADFDTDLDEINDTNHEANYTPTQVNTSIAKVNDDVLVPEESRDQVIQMLEGKLNKVIATIRSQEEELVMQSRELHCLLQRQERLHELSEHVEKAIDIKENVYVKLNELKERKTELVTKLSRARDGSLLYTELKRTLQSTEEDIQELTNAAKLHEFHHRLLTSDMGVEMEMRPTLDGYTQRLQSKIAELKCLVESERENKNVLKKSLIIAKGNLQPIENNSDPSKQIMQTIAPQMYTFQSGLRNLSIKKLKSHRLTDEHNLTNSDDLSVQSRADNKQKNRKAKKLRSKQNNSDARPTSLLPELSPSVYRPTLSQPGVQRRKPRMPSEQNADDWYKSTTSTNPNLEDQYSATGNETSSTIDAPSDSQRRSSRSMKGHRKTDKHHMLFTPQNGGRYRKSSGNGVYPRDTDKRISSSEDGECNFNERLSDYSMNNNPRVNVKDVNELPRTPYYPRKQSETLSLNSSKAKTHMTTKNIHRKPTMYRKHSNKTRHEPTEDNGSGNNRYMETYEDQVRDMSNDHEKNNRSSKKHSQQATRWDEYDVLSIPDDPDAGSSESNDSDFSEELKAKQQKLRELRHIHEVSRAHHTHANHPKFDNKQPRIYDTKRDKNGYEVQYIEATPPPPPGYKHRLDTKPGQSRIPVRI